MSHEHPIAWLSHRADAATAKAIAEFPARHAASVVLHRPRAAARTGMTVREASNARFVPALRFGWLNLTYDFVVATTTREWLFKTALIEQAGISSAQRILDLGCGNGTLAVEIALRFPESGDGGGRRSCDTAASRSQGGNAESTRSFRSCARAGPPYTDGMFQRVLSSLLFHHLSWPDKERAAREAFRVLAAGGELHVADWGRARGAHMRAAFVAIQILDSFANTHANVEGRLPLAFERAGFTDVEETRTFATMWGTLSLYRAIKSR